MVALALISISCFAVLAVRRSMFRIAWEVVVLIGVTSLLGYAMAPGIRAHPAARLATEPRPLRE